MTDYEKHTTHTDALDTLGTKITENEKRDAIHLAVFPCKAGHPLIAGQHVILTDDHRAMACMVGQGVGIVDPFLAEPVFEDDIFWLVVYPRQITSLRHVWEHPSFPPTDSVAPSRTAAETWLRDYSRQVDVSFERLVECCKGGGRGSQYVTILGEDASGAIDPAFWDYLGIYLGKTFGHSDRANYFSCSC